MPPCCPLPPCRASLGWCTALTTSTLADTPLFTAIFVSLTQILMFSLTGGLLGSRVGESVWRQYAIEVSSNRILTFGIPAAAPSSSVFGDSPFGGLRGQSSQVHGIHGAVYALISEEHTAINAHFVFLSSGRCSCGR